MTKLVHTIQEHFTLNDKIKSTIDSINKEQLSDNFGIIVAKNLFDIKENEYDNYSLSLNEIETLIKISKNIKLDTFLVDDEHFNKLVSDKELFHSFNEHSRMYEIFRDNSIKSIKINRFKYIKLLQKLNLRDNVRNDDYLITKDIKKAYNKLSLINKIENRLDGVISVVIDSENDSFVSEMLFRNIYETLNRYGNTLYLIREDLYVENVDKKLCDSETLDESEIDETDNETKKVMIEKTKPIYILTDESRFLIRKYITTIDNKSEEELRKELGFSKDEWLFTIKNDINFNLTKKQFKRVRKFINKLNKHYKVIDSDTISDLISFIKHCNLHIRQISKILNINTYVLECLYEHFDVIRKGEINNAIFISKKDYKNIRKLLSLK